MVSRVSGGGAVPAVSSREMASVPRCADQSPYTSRITNCPGLVGRTRHSKLPSSAISSSRSSNAAWLAGTLSSVYSPPSNWKLRSVVVPRLPVTT